MRSSEWVLIHYDWGLRERGSWDRHTHREDTMKEEGATSAKVLFTNKVTF